MSNTNENENVCVPPANCSAINCVKENDDSCPRIISVLDGGGNEDTTHGFNGSIFIYVFVTIIACIICFNLVLGLGSCRFSFQKKQDSDDEEGGTPSTPPPAIYTITVPECNNRITKPKTDSTSTQETNVSIASSPKSLRFYDDGEVFNHSSKKI